MTDSVPLLLTVREPQTDIRIENLVTDPTTLITSAELYNAGETVTQLDLNVVERGGSQLPADFIIQPDITHAYLRAGERLPITIIPLTIAEAGGTALLPHDDTVRLMSVRSGAAPFAQTGSGAASFDWQLCYGDTCETRQAELSNVCGAGTTPVDCDGSGEYTLSSAGWYCTNNRSVDFTLRLPFRRSQAQIDGARLDAAFGSRSGTTYNHTTNLSFNGTPLGGGVVPAQASLSFPVPPTLLDEWTQVVQLDSYHPYDNTAHYAWTSDLTLRVDVSNLMRRECRAPGQGGGMCLRTAFFIPASQSNQVCQGTINAGQDINVRPTPSTDLPAITRISPGTVVQISGQHTNSIGEVWYYTEFTGGAGWIRFDLVNLDTSLPECSTLPLLDENGNPPQDKLTFSITADNFLPVISETSTIQYTLTLINTSQVDDDPLQSIQVNGVITPAVVAEINEGTISTNQTTTFTWDVASLASGQAPLNTDINFIDATLPNGAVGRAIVTTATISANYSTNGLVNDNIQTVTVIPVTCMVSQPVTLSVYSTFNGSSTRIAQYLHLGIIGIHTGGEWYRVAYENNDTAVAGWVRVTDLSLPSECPDLPRVDDDGIVVLFTIAFTVPDLMPILTSPQSATVDYTLSLANDFSDTTLQNIAVQGSFSAAFATVTVADPTDVTLGEDSAGATTLAWTIPTLEVGAAQTRLVQATLPASALGVPVTSAVTITGGGLIAPVEKSITIVPVTCIVADPGSISVYAAIDTSTLISQISNHRVGIIGVHTVEAWYRVAYEEGGAALIGWAQAVGTLASAVSSSPACQNLPPVYANGNVIDTLATPTPRDVPNESRPFHDQAARFGLPLPFETLPVRDDQFPSGQGYGANSLSREIWSNAYRLTHGYHTGLDFNNGNNIADIYSICDGVVIPGRNTQNGGSIGTNTGLGLSIRCFMNDPLLVDPDNDGFPNLSNIVVTYNHLGSINDELDHYDIVQRGEKVAQTGQWYTCSHPDRCELSSSFALSCQPNDPTASCNKEYIHLHLEIWIARGYGHPINRNNPLRINPLLMWTTEMSNYQIQRMGPYYPVRRTVPSEIFEEDQFGIDVGDLDSWIPSGEVPISEDIQNLFYTLRQEEIGVQVPDDNGEYDGAEWTISTFAEMSDLSNHLQSDAFYVRDEEYTVYGNQTAPHCSNYTGIESLENVPNCEDEDGNPGVANDDVAAEIPSK